MPILGDAFFFALTLLRSHFHYETHRWNSFQHGESARHNTKHLTEKREKIRWKKDGTNIREHIYRRHGTKQSKPSWWHSNSMHGNCKKNLNISLSTNYCRTTRIHRSTHSLHLVRSLSKHIFLLSLPLWNFKHRPAAKNKKRKLHKNISNSMRSNIIPYTNIAIFAT